MNSRFPAAALRARARCGVAPSRVFLSVNVASQQIALFYRRNGAYVPVRILRCSTSKYGVGEVAGSYMTPRGLHRVAQKIGAGWPVGAVFKSRQRVGYTWRGQAEAPIAHRIVWLEGLEPGLNQGGSVDSLARYIYIHGIGNEATLGRPASCGCIHLSAADLLPLYDKLPEGTLVWIAER